MNLFIISSSVYLSKRKFKEDAKKASEEGDNSKAIGLFQYSLTQRGITMEERRETLQTLCELYFQKKDFKECLDSGHELKEDYPKGYKNEVTVNSRFALFFSSMATCVIRQVSSKIRSMKLEL